MHHLINLSLPSLHRFAGGTATPHLSFLCIDPCLRYVKDTPLGKRMDDFFAVFTFVGAETFMRIYEY